VRGALEIRVRRPWTDTYLAAGLVDELRLHLAPVLLGAGKRLFDYLGGQTIKLERTGVIESPYATHLYFTVRH
jgi:riboflavin biosynthesis pyrimidine reductase